MNYLQLYVDAFKHFFDFKGRTDRTAFWSFVIISAIVWFVLGLVSPALASLYGLVSFIPGLMLCIRRGRDAGSAWWALLVLLPLFGGIILGLLPRK